MPDAPAPAATPPAPAHAGPSLSSRAARGFAWAIAQTLVARVLGLLCQIILAKILLKEHFGAVAFAQSIAAFVAVIQLAGLPDILVQRQKRFATWSNAAFWMALTIGGCSAIFVAALGPLAAWYKGSSILIPIMLLVALQSVISALQVLPTALLQIHMRLRAITTLNLTQSVGGMAVSAALAFLNFGAFALVLGPLVASAGVLLWGWYLTRPKVHFHIHRRRWRFLWGDSALLLTIGVINTFVTQGSVFFLGMAHAESTVGVFSWAYMLSLQTIVLVTGSLNVVFFPTLSKLQDDPQRMLAAFLRAARVLAMIGVPACFLQAACAAWFIDLLFKDKWDDAAPAAVLLSVGLAFGVLSSLPVNLLKAAGLFKRLFWITIAYTVTFVACVAGAVWYSTRPGVTYHPASLVAFAVALVYLVSGPGGALLSITPFGGSWRDIWSIYGRATTAAAVAVGLAWSAARALPAVSHNHSAELLARLAVTVALSGALYLPIARFAMRDSFDEMFHRARELLVRRRAARA